MNCTNCGKPVEPGAKFCFNCGHPVAAASAQQPPSQPSADNQTPKIPNQPGSAHQSAQPSTTTTQTTTASSPAGETGEDIPAGSPASGNYISNPFALFVPSVKGFWNNVLRYLAIFIAFLGAAYAAPLVAAVVAGIMVATGARPGYITGTLLFIGIFAFAFLLAVVLSTFVSGVLIATLLASARGQRLKLKESQKMVVRNFKHLLGLTFIVGVLYIVGILGVVVLAEPITSTVYVLAAIIPVLAVLSLFAEAVLVLTSFIVINEGLGPVHAIKRSVNLARGHWLEMFGLLILLTIFYSLATIPLFGLIALVLLVVSMPAPAIRYLQLKRLKDTDSPKTKTSPANYVVIVLYAVLMIAVTVLLAVFGLSIAQKAGDSANSAERTKLENQSTGSKSLRASDEPSPTPGVSANATDLVTVDRPCFSFPLPKGNTVTNERTCVLTGSFAKDGAGVITVNGFTQSDAGVDENVASWKEFNKSDTIVSEAKMKVGQYDAVKVVHKSPGQYAVTTATAFVGTGNKYTISGQPVTGFEITGSYGTQYGEKDAFDQALASWQWK